MANNYKEFQLQFRSLVEKRTAEFVKAGKENFSHKTGVKAKKKSASLIASRVGYKEQHSLILEQMLAELKGVKKGKVNQSMLVEAAKRVKANEQAAVASL